MSAGTPVIAWRNGSVPELVDEGITGSIVASIDEAVEAVRNVGRLSRALVRARFEQRFTVSHMADNYLAAYRELLGSGEEVANTSAPLIPAPALKWPLAPLAGAGSGRVVRAN
jgi:hypothetical protein